MSTFNEYLVSTGALQPRRPNWSFAISSRPRRRWFANRLGGYSRPWWTSRDPGRRLAAFDS